MFMFLAGLVGEMDPDVLEHRSRRSRHLDDAREREACRNDGKRKGGRGSYGDETHAAPTASDRTRGSESGQAG